MPESPSIYCIDTSSIFEWYVRTYPPSIFPSLPERMEALIADGRLRSPKAVMDEIRQSQLARGYTGRTLEEMQAEEAARREENEEYEHIRK